MKNGDVRKSEKCSRKAVRRRLFKDEFDDKISAPFCVKPWSKV